MSADYLKNLPSVPQAFFYTLEKLQQIRPEWAASADSVLQAGIRGAQSLPRPLEKILPERLKKNVRNTLFNRTDQIQLISNFVSMGIVLFTCWKLIGEIQKKYDIALLPSFDQLNKGEGRAFLLLGANGVGFYAYTATAYALINFFNRRYHPEASSSRRLLQSLQDSIPQRKKDLERSIQVYQMRCARAYQVRTPSDNPANAVPTDEINAAEQEVHIAQMEMQNAQRYLRRTEDEIENFNKVFEIKWEASSGQKFAQYLSLTRIVLNVALLYFSSNRVSAIIDIAGQSYNLFKVAQLKWLSFSRTFQCEPAPLDLIRLSEITMTYRKAMFPYQGVNEEEQCTICSEEQPNTYFCSNHALHETCIPEYIYTFSNQFGNVEQISRKPTDHYRNGVHTHTTYSYAIDIKEDLFPKCPTCKGPTTQYEVGASLYDLAYGRHSADVRVINADAELPENLNANQQSSQLLEKIDLVYSLFQVGFTFLQSYPELAVLLLKKQKVFIVIDLALAAGVYWKLYETVKNKYKLEDHPKKLAIAAVVCLVASMAFSWWAVAQVNRFFKPSVDLKSALGSLSLSPEQLSQTSIDWERPWDQKLMQWIYVNRIIGNLALAVFSAKSKANLLNAAVQMLGLFNLTNLRWIKLEIATPSPLAKLDFKVVNDYSWNDAASYKRHLQKLTTSSYYLVDPACTSDPAKLHETLKTIHNCSKNILDKSSWTRFFLITTRDGAEVSRQLHYNVTLRPDAAAGLQGDQLPFLDTLQMRAVDSSYGDISVGVLNL